MKDPSGGRERVERLDAAVTGGPAATEAQVPTGNFINTGLNAFNTFHWDKRAMTTVPDGQVPPYSAATVVHWVTDGGTPLPIISSRKRPMENRTWYEYPSPGSRDVKTIARVVENSAGTGTVTQSQSFTYDSDGHLTTKTDPQGRLTQYIYGAANGKSVLTAIKQKTGATTFDTLVQYGAYNANNQPTQVTDAAGNVTTTTYGAGGRVESVARTRLVNGTAVTETTTYSYYADNDAQVSRRGRLAEVRGPGNVLLQSLDYDAFGRVNSVTGVDGYTVTTTYDDLDRPVRSITPTAPTNRRSTRSSMPRRKRTGQAAGPSPPTMPCGG